MGRVPFLHHLRKIAKRSKWMRMEREGMERREGRGGGEGQVVVLGGGACAAGGGSPPSAMVRLRAVCAVCGLVER